MSFCVTQHCLGRWKTKLLTIDILLYSVHLRLKIFEWNQRRDYPVVIAKKALSGIDGDFPQPSNVEKMLFLGFTAGFCEHRWNLIKIGLTKHLICEVTRTTRACFEHRNPFSKAQHGCSPRRLKTKESWTEICVQSTNTTGLATPHCCWRPLNWNNNLAPSLLLHSWLRHKAESNYATGTLLAYKGTAADFINLLLEIAKTCPCSWQNYFWGLKGVCLFICGKQIENHLQLCQRYGFDQQL